MSRAGLQVHTRYWEVRENQAVAKVPVLGYSCAEADRPWKCSLRTLGGAGKGKLEFAKWQSESEGRRRQSLLEEEFGDCEVGSSNNL